MGGDGTYLRDDPPPALCQPHTSLIAHTRLGPPEASHSLYLEEFINPARLTALSPYRPPSQLPGSDSALFEEEGGVTFDVAPVPLFLTAYRPMTIDSPEFLPTHFRNPATLIVYSTIAPSKDLRLNGGNYS